MHLPDEIHYGYKTIGIAYYYEAVFSDFLIKVAQSKM